MNRTLQPIWDLPKVGISRQKTEFKQQTWTFKTRQCGRSRVSTNHVCVGFPISQPLMGKESGMDLYSLW